MVHQRRAVAHEVVADPVPGLHVELRIGFERHEPHRWAGCRVGDGFGVTVVILLRLDVRAHVFRRHQSDPVPLHHEGLANVVRTAARLRCHDAPRQLRFEGDHRLAPLRRRSTTLPVPSSSTRLQLFLAKSILSTAIVIVPLRSTARPPCKPRVETQSAPESNDGGEGQSRGEVSGQFVVASGDPTEVFQSAEGRLHPPALAVALLVEPDLALARAGAGNDRRGVVRAQVFSQPVGVIAFVGDQAADMSGRLGQHIRGGLHVAGIARRQPEDDRAAYDIDEHVDLGRLTAARGADALRLGPPFPP